MLWRWVRLRALSETLPRLALRGIQEFNAGEFFEAHEYLEDAWRQEPRRVRYLYQGILQVGVGLYHQQNANWRGAIALLRRGISRLEEFEPQAMGVNVERLVRRSRRCLAELERLGPERIEDFDASLVPRVEWTQ